MVIVTFDNSVYVLDLINIPYIKNIVSFFQMYCSTIGQLFHSYSHYQKTICAAF